MAIVITKFRVISRLEKRFIQAAYPGQLIQSYQLNDILAYAGRG